jgi:hypothetical protein
MASQPITFHSPQGHFGRLPRIIISASGDGELRPSSIVVVAGVFASRAGRKLCLADRGG